MTGSPPSSSFLANHNLRMRRGMISSHEGLLPKSCDLSKPIRALGQGDLTDWGSPPRSPRRTPRQGHEQTPYQGLELMWSVIANQSLGTRRGPTEGTPLPKEETLLMRGPVSSSNSGDYSKAEISQMCPWLLVFLFGRKIKWRLVFFLLIVLLKNL